MKNPMTGIMDAASVAYAELCEAEALGQVGAEEMQAFVAIYNGICGVNRTYERLRVSIALANSRQQSNVIPFERRRA